MNFPADPVPALVGLHAAPARCSPSSCSPGSPTCASPRRASHTLIPDSPWLPVRSIVRVHHLYGGRPGFLPCLQVHFRRTSARCQPITVSGLNKRMLSARAVRPLLAASFSRTANTARGTFCQRGIRGPQPCLRSAIRNCCRTSMISRSFSSLHIPQIDTTSSMNSHPNKTT